MDRRLVTINFAETDYRLRNRITAAFFICCFLLAVSLGMMLTTARDMKSRIAAIDGRIGGLTAQEEKVRPILVEREQLVRDLSAMSGLLDARRFSWTRFLTGIETVVPVGVALSRIDFNTRDRVINVEGSALSPEALRNLMVGLEQSRSFGDPLLKHQSMDKGSILFNVAASYHENTASGPDRRPAQPAGK